jgi:hypothetical protein
MILRREGYMPQEYSENQNGSYCVVGSRVSRVSWKSIRKAQLGIGVALAIILCFATSTRADLVSGHVYGPDGNPLLNTTIVVELGNNRSTQFRTDAKGNFSVYLDPRRYAVHTDDNRYKGEIQSYSQPVQQDIHLR